MTAPADECGVTGGCHTCPLVTVCGDLVPSRPLSADVARHAEPKPEPIDASDPRYLTPFLAGMQAARFALVKRGWTTDAPMTTAEAVAEIVRERDACVRDLTTARDPEPVCVQTPTGRVPHGTTALVTALAAVLEEVTHAQFERAVLGDLSGDGPRGLLADAPDVDPNEPRPADAGCCGGGCG